MRSHNMKLYISAAAAVVIWQLAQQAGLHAAPYYGARSIPAVAMMFYILYMICFAASLFFALRTYRHLRPLWSPQRIRAYDPQSLSTSASLSVLSVAYEDGFMSAFGAARFDIPLMLCVSLLILTRIEFIVPPRAVT